MDKMQSNVVPSQTFDLEIWTANYEGALLPLRLAHVAKRCPSLARNSLATAIEVAKQGKDTQLYIHLHHLAATLQLPDLATPDQSWLSRQEELNKRELARLEGELRGYKNNLIRESIRMGQEDLAMHQLLTGGPPADPTMSQLQSYTGYSAAYQAFGKVREYCTTPTHMASMLLRLIYTSILQGVSAQQSSGTPFVPFSSVVSNAARLQTVGVKDEESAKLIPIMRAMTGLAQLSLGSYSDAAAAFIQTPEDYSRQGAVHMTDFSRLVASGNDIAIYGGLCALATMTRDDLSTKVLSGPFRAFLELEPHMRKAISLFVTAKYQACLATLTQYSGDWNLDVFLGAPTGRNDLTSHVDLLIANIREKSITAYFSSFSEVSLQSLAATFPPSQSSAEDATSPELAIEREVKSMITSGTLNARLDPTTGVVVAPHKDARTTTIAAASKTADEVERTLLLRLNKINMVIAGLEIVKSKAGGNSHGDEEGPFLGSRDGNLDGKVRG